ncbi:MAG: hypothetical protein ACP5I9_08135 [Candidatus Kapaibacteriota bacterium]
MKTKSAFLSLVFILFLNFFVWFKSLTLDFYNDDYQMLGFAQENFSAYPLNVFLIKDVSNYYFRPIPNLLITLFFNAFGYHPLPFRLLNFLLYLSLIFTIFFFFLRLFQNERTAFLSTILFSLLPSHDLYLVWIASIGDILATLFLLLAFHFILFSKKTSSLMFAILFFVLSCLSKESTLPLPFLAVSLAFLYPEKKETLCRFAFVSISVLALLFLFRQFVLGINIFASPNVQNFDLPTSLLNFFLYPFGLVIPTFAFSSENSLGIILNFIFFISLSTIFLFYALNIKEKNWKTIWLGLLWYFWLILPALPLFMRWYILLPSIGLFIIITEMLQHIKIKYFVSFLTPILIILLVVDYYSISGWKKANNFAQKILLETSFLKTYPQRKILLWFFPQYYNNYPILRSGIQQAINFNRNEKFEEVLLPISIVFAQNSKIELVQTDNNSFTFKVFAPRVFLAARNESISNEKVTVNDYYRLRIAPTTNPKEYLVFVQFLRDKAEYKNFYFDGTNFRKLEY